MDSDADAGTSQPRRGLWSFATGLVPQVGALAVFAWASRKAEESQAYRELGVGLAVLLGFGVLLMSVVAGTIVAINRGTRRFGLGMLLGTGIGMMLDLVMCGPLGFDLSPR